MSNGRTGTPRTIAEALRRGRQFLAASAADSPRLDAEILLRHTLGIDRTALYSRLQNAMTPEIDQEYRRLLGERAVGVPVAYLTGVKEFMGIEFAVGPNVLIPRPETEIMVEWALAWLSERRGATIVDVGTGSGAIALSLAALLPADADCDIIAVDVSPAALAIAARNQERLGLARRIRLEQGSLLTSIRSPIDLILANLPYLRPDQIEENPFLTAEPRLALDGGPDGLELVRELLWEAPRVVNAGGAIMLEIDPSQCLTVVKLASIAFPNARTRVLPDLAGHDRHVAIQL